MSSDNGLSLGNYLGRRVMDMIYVAMGYWFCHQVGPSYNMLGVLMLCMAALVYPLFLLERYRRNKNDEVGRGHEED